MTRSEDSTQYGTIGSQWEDARDLPTALPESHTLLGLLAPLVRGRKVLDMACGTGYYTRRISALGAREVLGTDISPTMIDAASAVEERSGPSGAAYRCVDSRDHPPVGVFDVVTAAYLLNYARDLPEMTAMARGARQNLGPGGVFIGVTQNPLFSLEGPEPDRYGFRFRQTGHSELGRFVEVTAALKPPVTFATCLATPEAYATALRDAGLTPPEWIMMTVPDRAVAEFGEPFWSNFRDNPPIVAFRSRVASEATTPC